MINEFKRGGDAFLQADLLIDDDCGGGGIDRADGGGGQNGEDDEGDRRQKPYGSRGDRGEREKKNGGGGSKCREKYEKSHEVGGGDNAGWERLGPGRILRVTPTEPE